MQKDKKVKIAATLEDGEIYSEKFAWFLYVLFALFLLLIPTIVLLAQYKNDGSMLVCLVIPIIIVPLLGYFVFTNARKEIKVSRCLRDGVELTALCEKVIAESPLPAKYKNKYIKISVSFEYKGKQKVVFSGKPGYKGRGSFEKAGFAQAFVNYANKEIKIIYSPKYNQVLLPEIFVKKGKNKNGGSPKVKL